MQEPPPSIQLVQFTYTMPDRWPAAPSEYIICYDILQCLRPHCHATVTVLTAITIL